MSQGAWAASGLILAGIWAGLWAGPGAAGPVLEPVAQLSWPAEPSGIGGLSGLIIRDDGAGLWAVSDQGELISARILRSRDGVPHGFEAVTRHVLTDTRGNPPRAFLANAEALADDGGAGFYVAYEAWARVWHYARPGAVPSWTHEWDRFWDRLGNEGFEALARDGAGRLYVISEQVSDAGFPVFVHDGTADGAWTRAFSLPARDGYLISGADIGPDGALYVLERRFRWLGGFATRIRRYGLSGAGPDAGALLFDGETGGLGNSEGIDVWTSPVDGGLRITLISDDNFSRFQRSVMTEFRLVD